MANRFGYAGKILRVDLSTGNIGELDTAPYADRFLGGRGIAAKIFWDEVSPQTRAFDPGNRLIFVTGPLAGYYGLAGSRWQICGKSAFASPESFSYCNLGGSWGGYLKFAGYDAVVVQGKSDKPVYILIQDEKVEMRDAASLGGKNTFETRDFLKGVHGSETRVATIGPAGENLCNMATVFADDDSSGSAGFGAVMGAKNLKAIAVRGSGRLAAADPEELDKLRRYARELRRDAPTIYACGLREPFLENNPKMKKSACLGCISGCTRANYQADDGKKSKFMCQPPMFYLDFARGYYGKENDVAYYAARLCDEYGLDALSVQGLLVWLRRCVRAGILSDEKVGLQFDRLGSLEFIETLVRKVALREGFGDVMAHGAVSAAEIVGGQAPGQIRDDIHRTGQFIHYGPRLYILTGILYAMEPRIPIQQLHEVSFIVHEWIDWYKKVAGSFVSTDVLRAVARRFFGSDIVFDFSTYEGKAVGAARIQDREYAKECLILCDFSWPMRYVRGTADHVGDPAVESRVVSAVTGRKLDETELCRLGERVFNLQRAVLVRDRGKGREADRIQETEFTVPLKMEFGNPDSLLPGRDGEAISRKGTVVDRRAFENLMDEYYRLRGWDVATGLQTRAKLEELEIADIAAELKTMGLLVE